jgi:ribosomal protein L34E
MTLLFCLLFDFVMGFRSFRRHVPSSGEEKSPSADMFQVWEKKKARLPTCSNFGRTFRKILRNVPTLGERFAARLSKILCK